MCDKQIIVIGGGPAGMMAAGTAGKRGHKVYLIEKNEKLGKKLYLTGKGRCNLTNDIDIRDFIENVPVNGDFLYSAFYTFSNYQLIELLNNLGLKTKVERGNRVFPVSDKASDVIKALKKYLKINNVRIVQKKVEKLKIDRNKVEGVKLTDGNIIYGDSIILATGGKAYPATGSTGDGYKFANKAGHTIKRLKPSLVPLEVKNNWINNLKGLKLKNIAITVYNDNEIIYQDFGEMEFIRNGISGPVVLSASSHMDDINVNKYSISIDLKPALSKNNLDRRIAKDFNKYSRKYFINSLSDLLPAKIIPIIVDMINIPRDKPVHQITKDERLLLVNLLKNIKIDITDYRSFKEAIITSGGINVSEINPSTMESNIVKGLYFAGEIIDVNGYTGGFNLQIAFSTGYLAGISC